MRKILLIIYCILICLGAHSQSSNAEYYIKEAKKHPNQRTTQIELYNKALLIDSTNLEALWGRLKAYESVWIIRGEKDNTYKNLLNKDLKKYISIDTLCAEAYYLKFRMDDFEGKYKNALTALNKAIEINNTRFSWFEKRAALKLKFKEFQSALQDYETTIRLARKDDDETMKRIVISNAYRNESYCWAKMQEYSKALKQINKAIKLNSTEHKNHLYRGNIYAEMNQFEKAIKEYSLIIKKNPFYLIAFVKRGNVYKALGQDNLANIDWQYALNEGYSIKNKRIGF
jgi:tetratricopeptide (TPR) repeat protein